jgi:hypothetical protein
VGALGELHSGKQPQPFPAKLLRPSPHHPSLRPTLPRWLNCSQRQSRPIWNSGGRRPCGGPGVHPPGGANIHKDVFSEIDFRISRIFTCYKKEDSTPSRVKPVPIIVVIFILSHANDDITIPEDRRAIADLICIAFYFLLRPGEYTGKKSNATPFRLRDVEFHINDLALLTLRAPISHLEAATTVSLTFNMQSNGNKGEILTHGLSTDLWACPVRATARRVIHLRAHTANPFTPLESFFVPPVESLSRPRMSLKPSGTLP